MEVAQQGQITPQLAKQALVWLGYDLKKQKMKKSNKQTWLIVGLGRSHFPPGFLMFSLSFECLTFPPFPRHVMHVDSDGQRLAGGVWNDQWWQHLCWWHLSWYQLPALTNRDGPTTCKCTIIPVSLEFHVNFDAWVYKWHPSLKRSDFKQLWKMRVERSGGLDLRHLQVSLHSGLLSHCWI